MFDILLLIKLMITFIFSAIFFISVAFLFLDDDNLESLFFILFLASYFIALFIGLIIVWTAL